MTAALRHKLVAKVARELNLAGVPTGHLLSHMDLEPEYVPPFVGCLLCMEARDGTVGHASV